MGWTIINTSEENSLDYSQLPATGITGLRQSLDGTKLCVKWIGDKPSCLSGRTDYTYEEIINILKGDEWVEHPTKLPE